MLLAQLMIAALFAVALMAAAPAASETTATPPTKAEKPKKADMVCKKEPVIGSRMPTRVCMTQADWDQRAVDAKADVVAAQRNRPINAN